MSMKRLPTDKRCAECYLTPYEVSTIIGAAEDVLDAYDELFNLPNKGTFQERLDRLHDDMRELYEAVYQETWLVDDEDQDTMPLLDDVRSIPEEER